MNSTLLLIAAIAAVILFFSIVLLIAWPYLSLGGKDRSLKNLVDSQRGNNKRRVSKRSTERKSIIETAKETDKVTRSSSVLTIEKKLKYAQWQEVPVIAFHAAEIFLGLLCMGFASFHFNLVLTLAAFFIGPILFRAVLNKKVDTRYKKFDADYPAFILSLVGLLKTGMSVMAAIDAAATGLDDGSLVKQEVVQMSERLRLGVPEEKSIGSFGEDIHHPEIELFVQALILSRRLGGNLSETLDRLAKQVRKRQYFRSSANAAIGLQKGSIWLIIIMLVFMVVYLSVIFPEAIYGAIAHPIGWQVWQGSILLICFGLFWIKQVTKLKI